MKLLDFGDVYTQDTRPDRRLLGFFSKLPQNRHPERSASQTHRVTQRLVRGVEGPRRCLSCPCRSGLFNYRSPHLADASRSFRGDEILSVQVRTSGRPCFELRGRKAANSTGKISIAGVLRLRAPSTVPRDKSATRSAQDDDSVEVLTKSTQTSQRLWDGVRGGNRNHTPHNSLSNHRTDRF
jgi:hypothetical protein